MLKSRSCAIEGREPCQVGNQAALSGLFDVPQECRLGADVAVTVCKRQFDIRAYGSVRGTDIF